MIEQRQRVVPAGWYEDPADPNILTWWNGLAWTEHHAPRPVAAESAGAADARTADATA